MRKFLPTALAALLLSGTALAAQPTSMPDEAPASLTTQVAGLGYQFVGFDADRNTLIGETVQERFVAPILREFGVSNDQVDFQYSVADIDGDGFREVMVRIADREHCEAMSGCRTYIFQRDIDSQDWRPIFHLHADMLAYRQGDGTSEPSVAAMMADGTVSYFTLTGERMYPEQDGAVLARDALASKGYEPVSARRINAEPSFLPVFKQFEQVAIDNSNDIVDPTGRFHFVDLDQDGMSEFALESRSSHDGPTRMIIMKRVDQGWTVAKEMPTFELGAIATASGGKAYGIEPVKPSQEFASRPRI